MKINLFKTPDGNWLTNIDLFNALKTIQANECKILYIHSKLNFGTPNPELKKTQLLKIILETIQELKVPTICVPTFTFSFCNGQDFNIDKSKSQMGIFNEYIRKLPESTRSVDPLMSVAVLGKDKSIISDLGHDSVGKDSHFDKIRNSNDVKFLFLGPKVGDCFTYMHYVEEIMNAPFRYNKPFTGMITNGSETYEDTYNLFVRYNGVIPGKGSYFYEEKLFENGISKRVGFGSGLITCFDNNKAHDMLVKMYEKDLNQFLLKPYDSNNKDKTFIVKNMVAL